MILFRCSPSEVVKDEPPDNWDEDESVDVEEKEKLRMKDKDLEFLFQEVVRDSSLDDYLKRDMQNKKSDSKYKEMLVSIMNTDAQLNPKCYCSRLRYFTDALKKEDYVDILMVNVIVSQWMQEEGFQF